MSRREPQALVRDGFATLAIAAVFACVFFGVIGLNSSLAHPLYGLFFGGVGLLVEPNLWSRLVPAFRRSPKWKFAAYLLNNAFWLSFIHSHLVTFRNVLTDDQVLIVLLLLLCLDLVSDNDFGIRTAPLFLAFGGWSLAHGGLADSIASLGMLVVVVLGYLRQRDRRHAQEHLRRTEERLIATSTELQHQERLANHDSLTAALNRRGFENVAKPVLAAAAEQHRPFCLMLFDLDHFKDVNDRFGHAEGDEALRRLVLRVEREIRPGLDFLGRYGGDEFLVGSIGLGEADEALAMADRIRESVVAHPLLPGLTLTVSIGVAFREPHAAIDYGGLLAMADTAMYESKRTRNSVRMARVSEDLRG